MSRTPQTRLSTRPDDRRSTPAGLAGYLAVLAAGFALLTAPVVVGVGLAVVGLAAVIVLLARAASRRRTSDRATAVGADADRGVDPNGRAAD